MARIPVENDRKGTPWWLWAAGVLVLGGLIWLLIEIMSPAEPLDEQRAAGDRMGAVDSMEAAGGAGVITDPAMLFTATDPAGLVGREVRLSSMEVTSVPGNSVFLVRPANIVATPQDEQARDLIVFVRLDEVIPSPPPDVEGRYNVEEGQTVTIHGTVQEIERTALSAWGLADEDEASLENERIYIHADQLDITGGATAE